MAVAAGASGLGARAGVAGRYGKSEADVRRILPAVERRDADLPVLIEAKKEYEKIK